LFVEERGGRIDCVLREGREGGLVVNLGREGREFTER
jgi:hypothetical protein